MFTEAPGLGDRHWKLNAIDAHAGTERPLAWIDDDHYGCEEWALDHTLHGLGTLDGSTTQLPDGWTGDKPGTGRDEHFCPAHTRPTPPGQST